MPSWPALKRFGNLRRIPEPLHHRTYSAVDGDSRASTLQICKHSEIYNLVGLFFFSGYSRILNTRTLLIVRWKSATFDDNCLLANIKKVTSFHFVTAQAATANLTISLKKIKTDF